MPWRRCKKATLKDLLFEPDDNVEIVDIHMPKALPGQHFHFDFGFMRSKAYQQKDEQGRMSQPQHV